MINSKKIYKNYVAADLLAAGKKSDFKSKLFYYFKGDKIFIFLILLRKCEFYKNTSASFFSNLIYWFYKIKFRRLSLKLGYSIPENVFGPGLSLPHYGTIVVNSNAKIGSNCRLHVCTVIGASGGEKGAPQIGNNVYIAPGAKIYGNIIIGNNNAIAANAAVNKSFIEEGNLIGGTPAKIIGQIDMKKLIKHL